MALGSGHAALPAEEPALPSCIEQERTGRIPAGQHARGTVATPLKRHALEHPLGPRQAENVQVGHMILLAADPQSVFLRLNAPQASPATGRVRHEQVGGVTARSRLLTSPGRYLAWPRQSLTCGTPNPPSAPSACWAPAALPDRRQRCCHRGRTTGWPAKPWTGPRARL